jgi:hypothetical protein
MMRAPAPVLDWPLDSRDLGIARTFVLFTDTRSMAKRGHKSRLQTALTLQMGLQSRRPCN